MIKMSNPTIIQDYQQLKAEAGSLLSDLGTSLITLVEAPSVDAEAAEAHRTIDEQLQSYWGRFYQLKKRHERSTLSVAVLALTKSGKSTLINALLGTEVLPVNNVPETARISRITHAPSSACPEPTLEINGTSISRLCSSPAALSPATSSDQYDLTRLASGSSSSSDGPVTVLTGAQQIREHLQQLNRDVRSREHLRSDDQVLDITAPLVVLDETSSQDHADSIKLCLLDTPGPNEAGEEGLKYQVERLLDRVDAAIYLLDYTKLKTAEEAQVLERLKSINPSLVARLCSRLFFAVNKMDQADESIGLDEEETREYVAEMVTRQLNCPDFRLHPDQVLLLSARNALLSRLVIAGRADPSNTQRFNRIAFGSFNPRVAGRSAELLRDAAEDMLQGSGVPELEDRVVGFLFEAAAGVKLVAILDDMGRLLTELSNVAASCRGALEASSARLAASTSALQDELSATLSQFDGVMEGTTDLQIEVVDELRAHLGNLRTRLFQFICSSLDIEAMRQDPAGAATAAEAAEAGRSHHHYRHHRKGGCHRSRRQRHRSQQQESGTCGSSSAAAAGSADCNSTAHDDDVFSDPETAAAAGDAAAAGVAAAAAAAAAANAGSGRGWWRLRQRFLRMFGGWLGGSAGCESRDELSSALMDLSEEIMAQIQSEVCDTWQVMERATNARAGRLITSLNAALEGLSSRLEGVVNEGLQIRLEPVSLEMQPPDAVSFHADLTELIEKGIAAEQARHVRACERTEMVWEARRGVCRLTEYYVQVPRRRCIVETYTATTYNLVPSAVADHFVGIVEKAIGETERHLAAYVKAYVRRQVAAARDKVKEYGDRYLDSMGAALETATRGADARAAALAQVQTYCTTLDALRGRQADLQSRAELLVPHNSGSGCGVFEQLDYALSEVGEEDAGQAEIGTGQQAVEVAGGHGAELSVVSQAEGSPEQKDEVQIGADARTDVSATAVAEASLLQLQQQEACEAGSVGSEAAAAVSAVAASAAVSEHVQKPQEGGNEQQLVNLLDSDEQQQQQQHEEEGGSQVASALLTTLTDVTVMEEEQQQQQQEEECADEAANATAVKSLSRSASGCSSSGSSSAQLLSLEEIEAAQQAEAAAAGVLLMASLPLQQQQQDQQETEGHGDEVAQATMTVATGVANEGRFVEAESAAAGDAAVGVPAAAAADGAFAVTADDILGGQPILTEANIPEVPAVVLPPPRPEQSAAAAVTDSGTDSLIDASDIEGIQMLPAGVGAGTEAVRGPFLNVPEMTATIVGPSQPCSMRPVVTVAPVEQYTSPTSSAVSNADTGVSDTFSAVSNACTDSTVFSGMTAGTGFTLGSSTTHHSGYSQLADNVLGRAGLMVSPVVPEAALVVSPGVPPELVGGAVGDSDIASSPPAAALATSALSDTSQHFGSSSNSLMKAGAAGVVSSSSGGGNASDSVSGSSSMQASAHAAATAADQIPLDTSLYASIIAHSDDAPAGGDGSPDGNSPFDFQQSFAAALAASGLDSLTGPLAPSGSIDSSSEDWLIVDEAAAAADEQRQQQ